MDQQRDLILVVAAMIGLDGTPGKDGAGFTADVPQKVDVVHAGGVEKPPTLLTAEPPSPPVAMVETVDVHGQDSAQLPLADHLGHPQVLRAKTSLVSHHQLDIGSVCRLDHVVAFLNIEGHRLFAEDMPSGFGSLQGQWLVEMIGCGQDHRLGLTVGEAASQRREARYFQTLAKSLHRLLVRVAEPNDAILWKRVDEVGEVGSEASTANHNNRQLIHS